MMREQLESMRRMGVGIVWLAVGMLPLHPAMAEELRGQLDWHRRVVLSLPVSGVVSEVNVEAGARVDRGAPLLKLDARPFTLAVRAARATLKSRKLAREEARRERDRAKELYERTLLSDHDLQLATIAFETAEADYQLALSELKRAELDREYSELRAPFAARVVARHAEVGQTVEAGLQPPVLFVLAAADQMQVRVVLDAEKAAGLAAGSEAQVRVAGQTFAARLAWVAPEAGQSATPRYEAVFVFDTAGANLLPGQSAEVALP